MKSTVYIEKTQNMAIILCRDTCNGAAVQVVRRINQRVPTNEVSGEMTTVKSHHLIKQLLIPLSNTFKDDVAKAVKEAKEIMKDMNQKDLEIDGVLNDYLSQNKGLNEDD